MRLMELFGHIKAHLLCGTWDAEVGDIVYDSRKNVTGTVFVCLKGMAFDGHDYIDDVIRRGAVAVVVERGCSENKWDIKAAEKVTVIAVENTRDALGEMSRAFFCYPEKELKLVGITGTKGKTTVTAMLSQILNGAGIKTGTMGTLGVCMEGQTIPLANTTPESYVVQKYLRAMADCGCKVCVMEVSSQALKCGRVAGIMFDCGVITNIYPDHIGPGEHESFEEYKYWKGQIFKLCRHCIVNGDDQNVMDLVQNKDADAETFYEKELEDCRWKVNLLGHFNAINALAAAKTARFLGVDEKNIECGLEQVRICGRCEIAARHNGGLLVIDYAHNGQALEMVLKELRAYTEGRLVCVFGCGGNRAKIRRKAMARAAVMYADKIIITSDNPRYEEPMAIIREIEDEILKMERLFGRKFEYQIIEDRHQAIETAYQSMRQGDVVLLSGKGHETYQEVRGVKYPFDERQIIADLEEKSV